MRPMKAPSESITEQAIQFPVIASAKLDGLRSLHVDGNVASKTLTRFPNRHVNSLYASAKLAGMDGELVVGPPMGEDVIRRTTSGVMSIEGTPAVMWWVFDDFTTPTATFDARHHALKRRVAGLPAELRKHVRLVEQVKVKDLEHLLEFEALCLSLGYEGLMLRHPQGPYKFGRSTAREGWLHKFKRFLDSEFTITGIEEGMHNTNEHKADGKRRTLKAGMVPAGVVGALLGMDCTTGQPIRVAPGRLTADERRYYFQRPEELLGRLGTYRHFPTGTYKAPRFPTFQNFRHKSNL